MGAEVESFEHCVETVVGKGYEPSTRWALPCSHELLMRRARHFWQQMRPRQSRVEHNGQSQGRRCTCH
eukprot:8584442-Alexandrium_andersonii.AAC.1